MNTTPATPATARLCECCGLPICCPSCQDMHHACRLTMGVWNARGYALRKLIVPPALVAHAEHAHAGRLPFIIVHGGN